MTQTTLTLQDGTTFQGDSPQTNNPLATGEVVFTTGMTGYIETLTDPSYAGQIICFTYPLIGNYGVPPQHTWESQKIHARGVIVSEACTNWSHSQSTQSLLEWLNKEQVSLITDIDTRALTKHLREVGTMAGTIHQGSQITVDTTKLITNPVSAVTITQEQTYTNGNKTIIAVDCGMKENIIRHLSQFPITIRRVPFDYDYTNEHFDGIFLSNGPGDPTDCQQTIDILKKAMTKQKPIFGICLGSQLMALAAGAKTFKLPYGHRGQNQPCIDTRTKRCYITSQNHGYAVEESSLPPDWSVTFRNLNDQSIEGIAHTSLPFFSVQFHPEANPGPTDTTFLFKQFIDLL